MRTKHYLELRCLFFSSLLVLAVTFPSLEASERSKTPLNEHMGVATHFSRKTPWMHPWDPQRHIPMIANMGVGWIRDEILWREVESEPGVYQIPEKTKEWVDIANAHGLKIIACFNNQNPAYENPYDPEAYAKAAAWLARELDGKIHAMEILNEPFGGFARLHSGGRKHIWTGREADGSVSPWLRDYSKFLNMAADAIKAANPRMTVVGLGCVMPQNYHLLEMGVSKNVDAITDHPYSFKTPAELVPHPDIPAYREKVGFAVADKEGSFDSYVRMCLEHSRKFDGPEQYWITESGWTTYREGNPKKSLYFDPFSPEAQAVYSQRRLLEGLGVGVGVNILYNFLDSYGRAGRGKPADPFDREQHFGLVGENDKPKPSYHAVSNVAQLTAGFTRGNAVKFRVFPFSNRGENEDPVEWDGLSAPAALNRIMVYPFTNREGQPVFAVWSAERINDRNARTADMEFQVDPSLYTVQMRDLMTDETAVLPGKDTGGWLTVEKMPVPFHPVLLTLLPKQIETSL